MPNSQVEWSAINKGITIKKKIQDQILLGHLKVIAVPFPPFLIVSFFLSYDDSDIIPSICHPKGTMDWLASQCLRMTCPSHYLAKHLFLCCANLFYQAFSVLHSSSCLHYRIHKQL